ncbi:M28 family metallopeptidase [Alkalibacillus salilacus]|uniref:Peptidase M28 domain-containing protein n=1 Tax=Alkalibacillus salilacus TaxID=284582 RepID=A0ABT9VHL9_9BACI|nr:M28 family peptidase [Alkalibacillus salilacus]MDQ0160454.1 hypothetical protein [Alkalibacillus salilacus]
MLASDWVSCVSEENLMEHTRQIAQYERLSGTDEERKAFQYINETLISFGLSPQLIEHEALISLPLDAKLSVDGEDLSCITHSMAPSEPGMQAPLYFVDKDYLNFLDSTDTSGHLALIHGLATPGTIRTLQELGFLGAIFINTSLTYEMIVSPVWGNPTPDKLKDFPEIPAVSVTKDTGDYLISLAKNHDSVYMETHVDTSIRHIPLLTVEIEANQHTKDFVLYSGHVDSWHYGAMDNGTANATMLEVARIVNNHRNQLNRNLRLAFWSGHSHGRYAGSAYYADQYWFDLYDNCIAHVNIDSVGGQNATVLTQANCMAETKQIATQSVGELTGQAFEGKRYGKAGDQSFWGVGIPSLYMGLSEQPPADHSKMDAHQEMFGQSGKSTGFGWWWHTTEDLVDKIEPKNLTRDCQVYVRSIHQLLVNKYIPIDQVAAIQDIKDGLMQWHNKAKGLIDLKPLLTQIERIESQLLDESRFNHLTIDRSNEITKSLSRYLVPFNYVRSSTFDFDTLFSLPKVPALLDINQLITLEPRSNDAFFLQTKIKRTINELAFQLHKVENLLEID